ncbi:nuclear transport factor 2 family protein [Kitasatospora sp. NPDC088391]|uniref:nuclear transport factor 2 family protein n=1 Tax=Kitasatospora sp. NPDC088391 TaxID=3364074 RepID=UPI0038124E6B
MTAPAAAVPDGPRRTVGVLIEDHFDATEFRLFNSWLPAHGYRVRYLSHLWGQPSLTFGSNPDDGTVEEHVTVTEEVAGADPAQYAGIICIGAYAMDRLRYQAELPPPGAPSTAPAVAFARAALAEPGVKVGAICHSLWLLCADPGLLRGRRVTCAHNIVGDVENTGAVVVRDTVGAATADLVVDGDLVTARHPEVTEEFLAAFVREIETAWAAPAARTAPAAAPVRGDAAMPTEQQVRTAVQGYVDSFNTRDRDKFLALLAEDVVQVDPVGSPANTGRAALADFWDGLFGSVEKVEFAVTDLIVSGDEAALTFHIVQTTPGGPVVVDGVDVFRIDGDGRIAEVRGYVDAAHVRAGSAGS